MIIRLASLCGLWILLGCDAPHAAGDRTAPQKQPSTTASQPAQQQREFVPQLLEEAQALIAASTSERFRKFDEQLRKVQAADKAGEYLDDEARRPFYEAARAAALQNELWRSLSVLWARLGEFDKAIHAAQQIPLLSQELPVRVSAPLLLAPERYKGGYQDFWRERDRQVPRETALSFIAAAGSIVGHTRSLGTGDGVVSQSLPREAK